MVLNRTTEAIRETSPEVLANALPKQLAVAIVYPWFKGYGGAEKVVEALAGIFPQADFYSLVAAELSLPPGLRGRPVKTSFVSRLPGAKRWHRHFLPLYPFALEQFDLSGYDLVISSESGPAKGVVTPPRACHICYCHTPMRYLWDMYHEYRKSMNPLTRAIFSATAHYARQWDVTTAARVDHFAANSCHVANRIRKYYRRESTVIYPPVDVSAGYISPQREDYYLAVGRLVPYKRIDLAIEACNRLGRQLRIVGMGPEYKRLRSLAGPTIEFLGKVDSDSLRECYAHCRALIFPAYEDFGIAPVEAQSFGRPVIAFGRGGTRETIIGPPSSRAVEKASGIFFDEQSIAALSQAVVAFEEVEADYKPEFIRTQAQRFSLDRFNEEFREFAAASVADFQAATDS